MTVLAHRVEGRGEPVVLLNGGLMTMASWDRIAHPLAEAFTVVRFDFRGQLRSPGAPPPDLEGHSADLAALLEHLELPAAHLVGTSFGGEVGLHFAATRPERTLSLVAATVTDLATGDFQAGGAWLGEACERTALGQDPRQLWDAMIPAFYSPAWRVLHEAELTLRREQFAGLPRDYFLGVADLLKSLQGLDLRMLLPRIACPTLLVVAGDDQVMPPDRPSAMALAIRQARLETIEGAGHALIVEQPDRFLGICLDFIRGVVQDSPDRAARTPRNP